MVGQIVEITQTGYSLKKSRGFLTVNCGGNLVGKIAMDDIVAIIISVPGCSVSTVLIDHLCQHNIPLVICGSNYIPTSITLPIQGHTRQFRTMRAQAELSQPRRKRAWKYVVSAKIRNQAELLSRISKDSGPLIRLSKKVRSGDVDNCEAQAAKYYWQNLFGPGFRRNRYELGINSAINYAYTVVRACVARGICGAGLHPSFSLHHRNPQNPLNLVDDLMEPFRPVADYMLIHKPIEYWRELNIETKSKLAAITTVRLTFQSESSPLSLATVKVARSFADYCLKDSNEFEYPTLPLPLEIAAVA